MIMRTNGSCERQLDETYILQQRIAELEQMIAEHHVTTHAVHEAEQFMRGVLDALTAHIAVLDETGTIIEVNKAWSIFAFLNASDTCLEAMGVGCNYLDGCARATEHGFAEAHDIGQGIRMVLAEQRENFELIYPCHSPHEERWFLVRVSCFENDTAQRVVVAHYNISAQYRAEQERVRLQEQIIATQQAAINELSTPLLPIADHVLALPLIGAIDAQRAQQIMETLLQGINRQRATIVILDITGVSVVDTHVAGMLIQTAQAAQLLGSQVVLTGIQPPIAQTLVHLGADLRTLVTRGTLQAGIAYALQRNGGSTR